MSIIQYSTGKEVLNLNQEGSNEPQITNIEVLTTKGLAERLSVSERTIYNWRDDGKIPHIRIGRVVRFVFCDVVEALGREERRAV